jgi:hypothetical protein
VKRLTDIAAGVIVIALTIFVVFAFAVGVILLARLL